MSQLNFRKTNLIYSVILMVSLLFINYGPAYADTITISGSTGIIGVTLTYDEGGIQTVTSGVGGTYSIVVNSGWTGDVTPTKTGYTFTPISITYSTPIVADISGQDYVPNFTISGSTGISGVTLTYDDGGTKTVTSGVAGAYSIVVASGWTGDVTPNIGRAS